MRDLFSSPEFINILGTVLVGLAGLIANLFAKLVTSVNHLNEKMAVVITKLENHENRINKLEDK